MTNLERFRFYSQCKEHTPLYVEFSFYSLIASCLQRRYYTSSPAYPIYPNLYLIFVGDPGTSKTISARTNLVILNKINQSWATKKGITSDDPIKSELIHIAPDSITVEQLIYRMASTTNGFTDSHLNGLTVFHSSVTFISEELGVLFKLNDTNLIEFLKAGWDCAEKFKRETVGKGHQAIGRPCINLIAGCTPVWIADGISYGILNDGFVGRAIFIWGGIPEKKITFFEETPEQAQALECIYHHCQHLCDDKGGFIDFSPDARKYLIDWYENKFSRLNDDKSLLHYYSRKKVLTMKLSLINFFSDYHEHKTIQTEHVASALGGLERVEVNMHLALASAGKNPIHKLAGDIFKFIKIKNKPFSKEILTVIFHQDGDEEEIEKALRYLLAAQKLIYFPPTEGITEWTYRINPEYKGD